MQYLSYKKADCVKTKNIPNQLINYGLKSALLGQNDFLKSSGSYPHFPKNPLVKMPWQGG